MTQVAAIAPQFARKTAKARQLTLARYHLVRRLASLYLATKTVKDRVFAWPPYREERDREGIDSLLANARHYLKGLDATLEFFLETGDGVVRCSSHPPYDRVVRQEKIGAEAAKRSLCRARFCTVWRLDGMRWGSSYRPYLYNIERGVGRYDANEWLRLTTDLYLASHEFPAHQAPLPAHPVNSCAVLGTGPSYEQFLNEADRYDAWIGANSVACDERVRQLGRPFAICMLDPHILSPLDSMLPTLEGVFALLRETPAVLITIRDFAAFIELNFPADLKRKCHYLPALGHDGISFGLADDLNRLMVTPYGNVLTDLMLPVAASISRKVVVYGCDGKKPGSEGFFDKGGVVSKVDDKQNEQLANVIDHSTYDYYVQMHNIFTRYVVDQCLGKGVDISVRRPSWNAGLQHLTVGTLCSDD